MEALNIIGTIINYCWGMLAFTVPGLGVSCQVFVTALLIINLSIALAHFAFGFGGNGSGYRSGDSRKKYIPEERRGDEQ